jgi:hypothetical protein
MSRQCPFPVRSTDNRRSYRAGSVPGCALGLALVAALLGYASFGHAAPSEQAHQPGAACSAMVAASNKPAGWVKGRLLPGQARASKVITV